jgi:hypothetical protein
MTDIDNLMLGKINDSLTGWLSEMSKSSSQIWRQINHDYELRSQLRDKCRRLGDEAYSDQNMNSLEELHQSLALIYDHDFSGADIEHVDIDKLPIFRDVASVLEESMLGYERSQITTAELSSYPEQGDEYVTWLKKMISDHDSKVHPMFDHYIAESATASDLALFLAQETSLDPRFDDILSLMQIGTQGAEKMEIANNYYDEMGNGNSEEVHTALFAKALKELNIDQKYINENMLLDSVIAGNLSSCLSLSRRHYYKSVGYFGVIKYLAPRRSKQVVAAWKRNNLPLEGVLYHKLNIAKDSARATGWLNNIIAPLVNQSPEIGREIAFGAMMRLNSSERYLDLLNSMFASKQAA